MTLDSSDPRAGCQGIVALPARLEAWQLSLCARSSEVAAWIDEHGSPLNVLDVSPMARNAGELAAAAGSCGAGVELKIFFARKANKALAFVDEALRLGLGVDVASERELRQTLGRGAAASAIVVTAAVKGRGLLELCAACGPTVVLDNDDELLSLRGVADAAGTRVPVALRLAPATARHPTRFGLPAGELLALVDRGWPAATTTTRLPIAGVHFHLDGYDPGERVRALDESLDLIDALRARGHRPTFVDIGGGIPTSYLDDGDAWERFWREHLAALRGERPPLTYDGHGLGLTAHAGGEVIGQANVYPYHQRPTRTGWLRQILEAPSSCRRSTIGAAIAGRGLELRCEPGRSLLDGCGMTAARVEFRKQRGDGTWLIGLAMNRTQCRSTSDDFLVDPLLLRPRGRERLAGSRLTGPIEGYLVGAYCIERELLTWRRLRFPDGVEVGDLVVFPNTAGYLMHILESASHQIPLARNLVLDAGGGAFLDPIDAG